MLSKKEFSSLFFMEAQSQVSAEIRVEEKRVSKINQSVTGVVLSDGSDVGAVIYPDQYYKQYERGEDIEKIVGEALQFALGANYKEMQKYLDGTRKIMGNYDMVKEHIYPIVINYGENRAFLQEVPHERYLDLAVIAAYIPQEGYEIKVTNSLAYTWEKTGDEILAQAKENAASQTPLKLMTMNSLIGEEIMRDEMPLYVLTNSKCRYGAFGITDTDMLGELEKKEGELYIFPSSIHEILVTPVNGAPADPIELEKMVCEINRSHVEPGEVLASHIYKFRDGKVRIMDKGKEVTLEQYQQNKRLRPPVLS